MENRWKYQVYFVLLVHNFIGGKGTRLNRNQFVVIRQNVKCVSQSESKLNFWLVMSYGETLVAQHGHKAKYHVCQCQGLISYL